jgi:hypothetical protein
MLEKFDYFLDVTSIFSSFCLSTIRLDTEEDTMVLFSFVISCQSSTAAFVVAAVVVVVVIASTLDLDIVTRSIKIVRNVFYSKFFLN